MIIIATIGPASMDKNIIGQIVKSGVNVLRLNFSHNSLDDFKMVINSARKLKPNIHIMQDLCGSKIRVSDSLEKSYKVFNREKAIFCSEEDYKKYNNMNNVIPLNIKRKDLEKINCRCITIKDNTMVFKVIDISNDYVVCNTLRGGVVRAGKGCNIKNYIRTHYELSDKDKRDLDFAYSNNFDMISQSYVESPEQILNIKRYISKHNGYSPKIYAKLETSKGIYNAADISKVSDGIIIGRGDLIPETSIFDVPIYEQYVLSKLKDTGKKVIFATHILDSTQKGYKLTLPEVEFICSAMRMGGSGFLLAGETSVGRSPLKAIKFLKTAIQKFEDIYEKNNVFISILWISVGILIYFLLIKSFIIFRI